MIYDVIILGAGASGLYLAAHLYGKKVLVIEKNTRPGLKLLAAGAGQCNVTHTGKAYELASHYGDKGKFVKKAIAMHDNEAVMAYFSLKGVPLWAREDGKVFPKSMRSKDVLKALLDEVHRFDTHLKLGETVLYCTHDSNHYTVKTTAQTYLCKNLVVATGGVTYPQLGATGIGHDIAKSFGHHVVAPHVGLAAVYTSSSAIKALQGLVLDDVSIQLDRVNKVVTGPLLFTHFGLSGPVIIDHSRDMRAGDVLKIAWVKGEEKEIEQMFLKMVDQTGHLPLNYYMNHLKLNEKIKALILQSCALNGELKLAEVSKVMRQNLMAHICRFPVPINHLSGLKEAMATAGGVDTSEVDPKTMASKKMAGLYFTGEVLDVDGDTGGYNLQWAFSSSYAVAQDLLRESII